MPSLRKFLATRPTSPDALPELVDLGPTVTYVSFIVTLLCLLGLALLPVGLLLLSYLASDRQER